MQRGQRRAPSPEPRQSSGTHPSIGGRKHASGGEREGQAGHCGSCWCSNLFALFDSSSFLQRVSPAEDTENVCLGPAPQPKEARSGSQVLAGNCSRHKLRRAA